MKAQPIGNLTNARFAKYRKTLIAILRVKSIEDFALKTLPLFAKLGWAMPVAFLLYLVIHPMVPPRPHGAKRLLILKKYIFNEDVLAAFRDVESVRIYGISRGVIKSIANGLLPPEIRRDERYVYPDPRVVELQQAYRRFLKLVWRRLSLLMRIDGVMSGFWWYYAERDLATALEELGIPFIVLDKEGMWAPKSGKMASDYARRHLGPFTGRKMLVYQDADRQVFLDGHLVPEEKLVVVGIPRLDRVHAWRHAASRGEVAARASRPTVLFLPFTPENYLPISWGANVELANWDAEGKLRWNTLCIETHTAIVRFAREHRDVKVIIRPRIDEIAMIGKLIDAVGPRPDNLKMVVGGDVFPLLQAAWVVCGFLTTALLEAIAAGKPVVVPHFAEALDPEYQGYIVDLEDAVDRATSTGELMALLRNYVTNPRPGADSLSPAAIRILDKWAANPDGRASERVAKAVLQELDAGSAMARHPSLARSEWRG